MSVSPVEFIRIAEESGLIVPLGNYVLDEACRQLAYWRRAIPGGESLQMSVNLSPRQMRASDIVDVVAETLDRHRLPGDALWLEITESVMMEDSLTTVAVMTGLRTLGVRLAVDDFGTGYSSLSHLARLPVDKVKIDREFVALLGEDGHAIAVAQTVVALARSLGLGTVAEGIETSAQAALALELEFDLGQGFLYQRPVTPERVIDLLAVEGRIVPEGDERLPQ